MINGREQCRTEITANTMETIEFDPPVNILSIGRVGDEDMAIKINGDVTGMDDVTSILLSGSIDVWSTAKGSVSKITAITPANVSLQTLQWDWR